MNDREIFMGALDRETPDERSRYLDEACGDDRELRRRVDALLQSYADSGGFLERPVLADEKTLGWNLETDPAGPRPPADDQPDLPDPGSDPISLDFLQPSDAPDSLGRLGQYEVREVVGRGGMGVVLKANDTKLNRIVAVKVLAPELASNAAARKRFVREAQAVAAVSHHHVVTIYAVEEDQLPYLAMEFIDGQSLQEKIDRQGQLQLREILRIGQQIAAGLAAAHGHGIIHRDIKPANVLLENGVERVRITDFGLARAVDDVSITRPGEVAGTPQFMSPEQAQGQPVDPRSDLFSLGSVLYTMCTGRPPFRADTTVAVLRRICDDTARPIREVNPDVPEWLVEIVERLLAKQPEDRFETAAEVAELLGRHLAHVQEPGSTPFPGRLPAAERRVGRARRRRFWLAAALILATVVGSLGISEATGVTNLAATVIRIATGEGTLVIEVDDPTVQISLDGEGVSITGAGIQELRLRPGQYQFEAIKGGQLVKQELLRIQRGGRQVVSVSHEPKTPTRPPSGSSPGQAGVGVRSEIIREVRTFAGSRQIARVAFTPDGKFLLGISGRRLHVWETETGRIVRSMKADGEIISLRISPDGRYAATGLNGSFDVLVWEIATGQQAQRLSGHEGRPFGLAFSADGTRFYSRGIDQDGTIREWDLERGQLLKTHPRSPAGCSVLAVLPGGDRLLTLVRGTALGVIDMESGAVVGALLGSHEGEIKSLDVTIDGARAVTCSMDGTLRIWDVAARREVQRMVTGEYQPRGVAFVPGGHFVVSSGLDGTAGTWSVRLWDVATGAEVTRWTSEDAAERIAVSSSGRYVGVCGTERADGPARLLELTPGDSRGAAPVPSPPSEFGGGAPASPPPSDYEVRRYVGHTAGVVCVSVSPDGKRILSASDDGTVRLWDLETGAELRCFRGHSNSVRTAAFLLDGRRLASASWDRTVRIWDAETGEELQRLTGHRDSVERVAVLPDGKRVASASLDRTVRVWDVESGRQIGILELDQPVSGVAALPDGRHVLCGDKAGVLQLWDLDGPSLVRRLEGHTDCVKDIAVSPDGRRALSAGATDGTVRVWDLQTGEELRRFEGYGGWAHSAAFGQSGELALTGGHTRMFLWDLETGRRLGTFQAPSHFAGVAFVCNDVHVVSAHWTETRKDDVLRLWELPESLWPEAAVLDRLVQVSKSIEAEPDDMRLVHQRGRLYMRLGRYDEAARDFIRANELSPQGWDATSALFGSLIEHEEVFARIAELRPDDLALWGRRGHYYALRSQWKQALPGYARVSEGSRPISSYAYVLLLADDEDGYRRECQRMAARLGQTDQPDTARHLVQVCSAGPRSGIDPARIVELAQFSVRSGRNSFTLQALAWAHYRAGQFDQAVTLLDEAMDLPEGMSKSVAAFPLALAYRGLGQEEESRKWYQTGVAELERVTPRDPNNPVSRESTHWLRVNVWYREAKTVFEPTEPQAPKTEEPK